MGSWMIISLHDLCWVRRWKKFRISVNICRSYGQLSRKVMAVYLWVYGFRLTTQDRDQLRNHRFVSRKGQAIRLRLWYRKERRTRWRRVGRSPLYLPTPTCECVCSAPGPRTTSSDCSGSRWRNWRTNSNTAAALEVASWARTQQTRNSKNQRRHR